MKTLEEIEMDLKAVTDNVGRMMDQIAQKGFVPVFQCGHSGLYFPGDYVKGWGRLYGIGLGIHPVSEVLDTDYETAPPIITPDVRSIEQILHPVGNTLAQVDLMLVHPSQVQGNEAVLAQRDPMMDRRMSIVRQKQLKNPASRVPTMYAAWKQARREG